MPRAPLPDPQLGAVLRRLREAQGLTLEALAHEVGITTGTLSRIEIAQSAPAWWTVRKIADALGVSLPKLGKQIEAEGK
jgi:transcriptional regulator with XRE-family HTH domain